MTISRAMFSFVLQPGYRRWFAFPFLIARTNLGAIYLVHSHNEKASASAMVPNKRQKADSHTHNTHTKRELTSMVLEKFGENIWICDGPTVNFLGFPYPTRMVVIKLSTSSHNSGEEENGSWIWSPIELTEKIMSEVQEKAGTVKYIVSPNKIHHIFLQQWSNRYPNAKVYSSPGLKHRKIVPSTVQFDECLGDEPPNESYGNDIDQVIFHGSFVMEEVAFFHKKSKTAIFADLIQRFPKSSIKGITGTLMKLDGLVGEKGSTPREWRLTFLFGKPKTRAARQKVLSWSPEKLVIAHGECAKEGATEIIQDALSWI